MVVVSALDSDTAVTDIAVVVILSANFPEFVLSMFLMFVFDHAPACTVDHGTNSGAAVIIAVAVVFVATSDDAHVVAALLFLTWLFRLFLLLPLTLLPPALLLFLKLLMLMFLFLLVMLQLVLHMVPWGNRQPAILTNVFAISLLEIH